MGLRGINAVLKPRDARKAPKPKREAWENAKLSRYERVIVFLSELPVTKGILAGESMELLPDQLKFVKDCYAERPDGRRLTTLAIKSEPKGNGKTGLAAALALCHLLGPESEARGEVYSAAIDRPQAAIMFAEMEAIIARVPKYKARVNVVRFHKKMEVMSGPGAGSVYAALSADARSAHGLAPSLWVYDELAQAKSRELLDNLMQGMSKRKEALGIVISTQAATDSHPLSQLIDDAAAGNEASTLLQLHAAPAEADAFDPKVWKACNPAWGKFLNPEDFKKAADRARRMPAFEPAFRNLRLNQRIESNAEARIVSRGQWEIGAVPLDLDALRGRECYGGLDLSGKHDLSALVLAFPNADGSLDILPTFWTPLGQLEDRAPAERDLFKLWIRQGHLIGVPGPTIRFEWIAAAIAELGQKFDIRSIGYDRWRITDLKIDLEEIGCDVPLEPFGQGFKDMAPAVELFADKALAGLLRHGGHPVLTASVMSAILVSDPAGNQKFDKGKSNAATVRIDGAVALTMSIGLASRRQPDPGKLLEAAIMERGGFA